MISRGYFDRGSPTAPEADRAGFEIIATGLRECLDEDGEADRESLTQEDLDQLFLAPA
ncbi:hypothetical protein [Nocardia sp. NPDC024068]|uniref:hypothetical protein n=1 Tax=Nocardia sp. NPDC024068 TaxID=3157197 RepID=UPI0033F56D60